MCTLYTQGLNEYSLLFEKLESPWSQVTFTSIHCHCEVFSLRGVTREERLFCFLMRRGY